MSDDTSEILKRLRAKAGLYRWEHGDHTRSIHDDAVQEIERRLDEVKRLRVALELSHEIIRKEIGQMRAALEEVQTRALQAQPYYGLDAARSFEAIVQTADKALNGLDSTAQEPAPLAGPGAKPLSRMSWAELHQIYPRE